MYVRRGGKGSELLSTRNLREGGENVRVTREGRVVGGGITVNCVSPPSPPATSPLSSPGNALARGGKATGRYERGKGRERENAIGWGWTKHGNGC